MVRVGVVSDTHLREYDEAFARRLAQALGEVDLVLHAGDLVSLVVLDMLPGEQVYAVAGNMDLPPVQAQLPAKRVVEIAGRRIGLIHGWGAPIGLARRVKAEFEGENVECIVFGHSHRPMNEVVDGVVMFNPGSAAKGWLGSGSVGVLEVDEGGIRGRILKLP